MNFVRPIGETKHAPGRRMSAKGVPEPRLGDAEACALRSEEARDGQRRRIRFGDPP